MGHDSKVDFGRHEKSAGVLEWHRVGNRRSSHKWHGGKSVRNEWTRTYLYRRCIAGYPRNQNRTSHEIRKVDLRTAINLKDFPSAINTRKERVGIVELQSRVGNLLQHRNRRWKVAKHYSTFDRPVTIIIKLETNIFKH